MARSVAAVGDERGVAIDVDGLRQTLEPLLEEEADYDTDPAHWKRLEDPDGHNPWEKLAFRELHENYRLEGSALKEFEELQMAHKILMDELRTGWNNGSEYAYEGKRTKMKNLMEIWGKITPQKFVVTVSMLGQNCRDYLKLLSFPLHDDDWLVKGEGQETDGEPWQWLKAARLQDAYGVYESECLRDFPTYENLREENQTFKDECASAVTTPWPRQGPLKWLRSVPRLSYWFNPPKVTHAVHWTAATKLLIDVDTESALRMIRALQNCGESSEAFNTLVPRMIARKAWEKVRALFYWRMFLDIVFLMSLALLSGYIIWGGEKGQIPPGWMRWWVTILSIRSVAVPFSEMYLMVKQFGIHEAFNNYLTCWNIVTLATEVTNAGILLTLMVKDWNQLDHWWSLTGLQKQHCSYSNHAESKCAIIWHPVAFACAIGLKWTQSMFEMMCLPYLGHFVLPAFYAVIGKDTRWFVLFLGFVLAGSFQSYWSLPIPDNLPAPGVSHIAKVFLKIFKLDILGDVDIWDLEGENNVVNITKTKDGNFTGNFIHHVQESDLYHDAIIILICFNVLIVSMLFMNVTIGIVGMAYDRNKSNKNHIWCQYRATYIVSLLLRNDAWNWLCPCVHKDDLVPRNGYDDVQGIFIGCHEAYFLDPNDIKEELEEIIAQEMNVGEQVERVSRCVKDFKEQVGQRDSGDISDRRTEKQKESEDVMKLKEELEKVKEELRLYKDKKGSETGHQEKHEKTSRSISFRIGR